MRTPAHFIVRFAIDTPWPVNNLDNAHLELVSHHVSYLMGPLGGERQYSWDLVKNFLL